MNRIIERSFIEAAGKDNEDKGDKGVGHSPSGDEDSGMDTKEPTNNGTLITDATCTPADIVFPTDLELCNQTYRWTEVILDHYWKLFGSLNGTGEKPRTYREIAHQRFLELNKRRKINGDDNPERTPLPDRMYPPQP